MVLAWFRHGFSTTLACFWHVLVAWFWQGFSLALVHVLHVCCDVLGWCWCDYGMVFTSFSMVLACSLHVRCTVFCMVVHDCGLVLIWFWHDFGMAWHGLGMVLASCWPGFDMVIALFHMVLSWSRHVFGRVCSRGIGLVLAWFLACLLHGFGMVLLWFWREFGMGLA
jgi:hypothetical protein